MECGHSQGLPEIFWVPPIISGTGKAIDFKFCKHIKWEQKPVKHFGESSCGRSQGVQIFRAPIGRIARSSLRQHSFLVFITSSLCA